MTIFRAFLAILALLSLPAQGQSLSTCHGKWLNPITDICWSCVMPISIGAINVTPGTQRDIPNPPSPICVCPGFPIRIGVSIGFWEPARQVDVTKSPFCMVAMGGLNLSPGIATPEGAQNTRLQGTATTSFYHAHYYLNPVLSWMGVLLDNVCVENDTFDIAYLTEVDPLWKDDELTLIINPDAILFANPIAVAACAVDCVAATAHFGIAEMFWCAGCNGSIFPMNGRVSAHLGGIQASSLVTQRMTAKMHRQMLAWAYHGPAALCGPYPLPVMDKTAYKPQLTYPIPSTLKIDGRCCHAFGETTQLWGAGKEYPVAGEDFSYLLFRKRNCCVS